MTFFFGSISIFDEEAYLLSIVRSGIYINGILMRPHGHLSLDLVNGGHGCGVTASAEMTGVYIDPLSVWCAEYFFFSGP